MPAAPRASGASATRMTSVASSRLRSGRRAAAALACALLALCAFPRAEARGAAARSASSASGGSSDTATGATIVGSLAAVLDTSPDSVAAKANVIAAVAPALAGVTLRCADINIMRTGTAEKDAGDGFAHLNQANPGLVPLMASMAKTPINGVYPLTADQLDGANVWLLGYIAGAAGMSVSIETVFLPDALFYSGNRTAQMAYLFGTLKYDCMVSSTLVRAEQLALADFLLPNEQTGLSVFTRLDAAADFPITTMLFAWTQPFSWEIWVTVVASLTFGGIAMYFFEGEDEGEDYGPQELHFVLRIARGCYKAFLNFSSAGGFSPNTPAGQVFNIAFSFAMLLLQAAYTANLAAYFTRNAGAASPINSIGDFGGKHLSACVLNDAYVADMMRSAFPLTPLVVLPSIDLADLLLAVQNGTCAGGVAPDLMLRYALGPLDWQGAFCNLQFTGGLLSQQYFGIPFNSASPSVNPVMMSAMNAIAALAFNYGEYATQASMSAFPNERDTCAGFVAAQAQNPLQALNIRQVSGIFFLITFGCGLAGLFFVAFKLWRVGVVDEGTELERALKARQKAELAALQADEAAGTVDGTRLGGDGKPVRASSAAWLARINGGGATNSASAAAAPAPAAGAEVSRSVAVEALAAALAREAAAVMDVPSRTTAAIERAVAVRGGYMMVTMRLYDAAGKSYGQEVDTGPLTRPADWQFLYTRLGPNDAAEFNRALRALAGGSSSANVPAAAEPGPLSPRLSDPRLLAARSANPRLDQVVAQRDSPAGPEQRRVRRVSQPAPPPPPPQSSMPPIAFPSIRSWNRFFNINRPEEAPPPEPEAKPRRRRAPSGEDSGGAEQRSVGRSSRSAPPGGRRQQIPAFDDLN